MSRAKLRIVADNTARSNAFPFNHEAQDAWDEAADAARAADVGEGVARVSMGGPGSAEKLRRATELLRQAATIVQELRDCPEEDRRYAHWEDIYDNPRRRETFGNG
jgi:hypothetical protein